MNNQRRQNRSSNILNDEQREMRRMRDRERRRGMSQEQRESYLARRRETYRQRRERSQNASLEAQPNITAHESHTYQQERNPRIEIEQIENVPAAIMKVYSTNLQSSMVEKQYTAEVEENTYYTGLFSYFRRQICYKY